MVLPRLNFICCLLAFAGVGCTAPAGRQPAFVDVDAQFAAAARLRSGGRHLESAKAFAAFVRRFDHDPRADFAQFLAGEEYLAAGQTDPALEAFRTLFRLFPHSQYLDRANAACVKAGRDLLTAGNLKGVAILESALTRAPYGEQAAQAHLALGRYYYGKSRFADARAEFDEATAALKGIAASPIATSAELGAALAEFNQVGRTSRNINYLLDARKRLQRLQKSPLTADEARLVDRCLAEIEDRAAEREMDLAGFYLKQGQVAPALTHLRTILAEYPGTRYRQAVTDLVLFVEQEVRKASNEK